MGRGPLNGYGTVRRREVAFRQRATRRKHARLRSRNVVSCCGTSHTTLGSLRGPPHLAESMLVSFSWRKVLSVLAIQTPAGHMAPSHRSSGGPPTFSSAPMVSFPTYRSITFPSFNQPTTRLHIICPWSGRLGTTFEQGASPPNTTTLVTGGAQVPAQDFLDPYATSLLSNPNPTGEAWNAVSHRHTRLCVEMTCSHTLSTISGSVRIMKWPYGGVSVVSTRAATDFYDVTESILSQSNVIPRSMATFVNTHCTHTAMRDRSAIEFFPASSNSGNWFEVYGKTDGTLDVLGALGCPWVPILIMVTGSSIPEYMLTVKGSMDILPAIQTAMWRLARPPPVPKNGQEEAWWALQRKHESSTPYPVGGAASRSTAGITGVPSQTTTTTSRPQRLRKQGHSTGGSKATKALKAVADTAKSAARAAVNSQVGNAVGRAAGKAILNLVQPQQRRYDAIGYGAPADLRRLKGKKGRR